MPQNAPTFVIRLLHKLMKATDSQDEANSVPAKYVIQNSLP